MHPTEQMLTALYGWLVLRMKKETISVETEAAMVAIRQMANVLARGHIRVYEGR
jgi:very-short-patch-repair endonuclease